MSQLGSTGQSGGIGRYILKSRELLSRQLRKLACRLSGVGTGQPSETDRTLSSIESSTFDGHRHSTLYNIGTQVHDHEARLRLLERDSAVLDNRLSQLEQKITGMHTELHERLTGIAETLDSHVHKEDSDRTKLMAMSIGQFLTVVLGFVLIFLGKAV
jgi:hypothetical protein